MLEVLLPQGEFVGGYVVYVVEDVLDVVEEGFEEHLDDFVLYLGGEGLLGEHEVVVFAQTCYFLVGKGYDGLFFQQ